MSLPIFEQSILEERPHISFSEAYSFSKCPHNHWLSYREKTPREDTIYTVFGKAVGEALEQTRKHNNKVAWITLSKRIFRFVLENGWGEMVNEKDQDWRTWARAGFRVYKDTLDYLDTTYPGWELIDFEYPLYEPIEGTNKKFKGFIDIIFKHDGRIYLLDFKTCSFGWDADKRSDIQKLYQVALYKHFYCQKTGTDPGLIDTGFLLLKRKPAKKDPSSVELFAQTSGTKKLSNAVEWLSKQARGIEKGVKIKNKITCSFCQCGESNESKKWEEIRNRKK